MSNQHVLKIHPAPLADLLSGAKTAEVRRNDRGFEVGDTVRLIEVCPETGNWIGAEDHVRTISHIQTGYGLPDGMCVLSYADTTQAQLAEAVGLLWFIQGYLEDGQDSSVKSKIRSFISRHRLDEHAQAEQQEAVPRLVSYSEEMATCTLNYKGREYYFTLDGRSDEEAQGAQAGDERAAFEAWHRSRFGTKWQTGNPTRDMHNGIKAEKYGPEEQQIRWECWQARAALATQPADVDPAPEFFVEFATLRRAMSIYGLSAPESDHELGSRMERYAIRVIEAVAKLPFPYPPAGAHGDEAVCFESPEALAKAISDHCGYAEVNSALVAGRIFAAMRAQGDGGAA